MTMTSTVPNARMGDSFSPAMLGRALGDAFVKLDPRKLTGNPVIFATEIVAILASVSTALAIRDHTAWGFALQIALWLWATVLFANFAESVAEGRGKAAADSLRATRVTTKAKLIVDEKTGLMVPTPAHAASRTPPANLAPTKPARPLSARSVRLCRPSGQRLRPSLKRYAGNEVAKLHRCLGSFVCDSRCCAN